MRPSVTVVLLSLIAGPLVSGFAVPRVAQGDVTAKEVRRAIDDAVGYLRKQQLDDGTWKEMGVVQGGVTALCTLSLLNAGVPISDPALQKALTQVRKIDGKWTYVVALQTMVLCAAEPEKDGDLIRRNVLYLTSNQNRDEKTAGCWGYNDRAGRGDNSNAQFALLALHEAERAGVPTNEATWRLARDYWRRTQSADGSWGYLPGDTGTGSMTCAGIVSMIVASEKLDPGDARVVDERVECCGMQTPNESVDRGLWWLAEHYSVRHNPGDPRGHLLYYLYGIERVGRMSNRRLIGLHDWYRQGADVLVRSQAQLRGHWTGIGAGESNPVVGTSLALLFLSKGRRPVLVAKLIHEPEQDWNRHRRDLANLTTYCERKWKRELTWQVLPLKKATVDDLLQAPVLFLSGSTAPNFTDDEAINLRKYLDAGGSLFAENACGSAEFDKGFRTLMEQVFPERNDRGTPLHSLRLLPPDHAVWAADEPIDPKFLRPLHGIDVGSRTCVIYCPEKLGCYWDLDRPGRKPTYPATVEDEIRAVRSIGMNVMTYATKREIKFKLEVPQ